VLNLSLMAGLATATAIEKVAGVRPDLRWPNDLLLPSYTPGAVPEQRKFCGILTEMNAEITRVRFAVVGIGINVNQTEFPADLASLATSLRLETGRSWSRVELAAALLQSLDREYRRLQSGPTAGAELFRRFEQSSSYARGRRVHVDEGEGYTGVTAGLNAAGFLLINADDGTLKTVISGGVRAI
jgi:BirA family biotin operon repressor/biotin-[acetyl-CoA-carboxylase] ligase